MKKIYALFGFILIGNLMLHGQEIIEKTYCKNKFGDPAKSAEKAKYIKVVIKEDDGTIRCETKDILTDKIVYAYNYKDKVPVGKWIMLSGTELNYDFEVMYKDSLYKNIYSYDLKERKLKGNVPDNFEPPIYLGDNNYLRYIMNKLQYPPIAAEMGIQGEVIVQFIINEEGKMCELSIYKSASKILDKEAARVIRESINWEPAKLDGKKIPITILQSIVFQLQ
jgi:TonB family protein